MFDRLNILVSHSFIQIPTQGAYNLGSCLQDGEGSPSGGASVTCPLFCKLTHQPMPVHTREATHISQTRSKLGSQVIFLPGSLSQTTYHRQSNVRQWQAFNPLVEQARKDGYAKFPSFPKHLGTKSLLVREP